MKIKCRLYYTILTILSQHKEWLDKRHKKALAWMVVGAIYEGSVSLSRWAIYVESRAKYAQSKIRRFRRWLSNRRIDVHRLYAPLIKKALEGWEGKIYLALDTSMLFGRYCIVKISVLAAGRGIPIVWKVMEHRSAKVSFKVYKQLLERCKEVIPKGVKVILLADRGFCDLELLKYLKVLGWSYRIRIKRDFIVEYKGERMRVGGIRMRKGEARFMNGAYLGLERYGEVNVAIGWSKGGKERWDLVSDELVSVETFKEYGRREGIEGNILDEKSNGFNLQRSKIETAEGLERLIMVISVAILYLVSCGIEVEREGKRREIDGHWDRGMSYMKIGWGWVKSRISRGEGLWEKICLKGIEDKEPCMGGRRDRQRRELLYSFSL